MNTLPDDSDRILACLFSELSKISLQFRRMELPRGFTPERLRTLSVIQTEGPISVTRLADLERVRPATVSRMVSSLEAEGYVKRRQDKSDRRSVILSTTKKGREAYRRANRQFLRQLNESLKTLEPSQLETVSKLARLLERLNKALDA